MTKFKKVIATAEAKVAKAEAEAFAARLEAIEAILQNASEYDVLMLCARVLATVVPDCCDKHQEEFKGELLRVLSGGGSSLITSSASELSTTSS